MVVLVSTIWYPRWWCWYPRFGVSTIVVLVSTIWYLRWWWCRWLSVVAVWRRWARTTTPSRCRWFVVVGHPTTTLLQVVRGLYYTDVVPEKWFFVLPGATNRAMSALFRRFSIARRRLRHVRPLPNGIALGACVFSAYPRGGGLTAISGEAVLRYHHIPPFHWRVFSFFTARGPFDQSQNE